MTIRNTAASFDGVVHYNRGVPESTSKTSAAFCGDDPFGSTRWSLVLAAGRDGPVARDALESLCHTYWFPVYAFVRRRANNSDDARDLTQTFFAMLLEKQTIAAADQSRGRFRAFLLTTLKNFLANDHARALAQKRGGGQAVFSLSFEVAEKSLRRGVSSRLTPEQEFERRWALALLDRVISRLEAEQAEAGRQEQFESLRLFLTGQNADTTNADVAHQLNISEEAVRAAVYRLRKRYRLLLHDEIAQTVTSADEVDEELRKLLGAVSS